MPGPLRRRGLRSTAVSTSASVAASQEDDNDIQPVAVTLTDNTDSQLTSQLNEIQADEEGSSDNDDIEEEYGDMHRLVLQGVMSAGYMDSKGVKRLFQESGKFLKCQVPAGNEIYPYIQKVVREINEKIKIYGMVIRSATCEMTGHKYYIFLVTHEKPIMKMQTYFTKAELEFFQKILDSLLRKHANFAISKIECINMVAELDSRAISKVNGEDFVDKMIRMKYFTKVYKDADKTERDKNEEDRNKNEEDKNEEDMDYDITLGFRTIREFEPIFTDVYGDIFGNCCLCKMILLNGLQCPKCPVVVHRACLTKYIKSCKTCVCITCKCLWENENVLLVRTRDGSGEPSSFAQISSQTGESSQSGRFAVTGDDVEMPVLEPVGSPRSTRTGQSSKKDKKSKKTPVKSQSTRASKRKIPISSSSESDSK